MVNTNLTANALARAIYGKPIVDGVPTEREDFLGLSEGVTPEMALSWRQMVSLEPVAHPSAEDSQAVGIFSGLGEDFILARAHNQLDNQNLPIYEYILLPCDILRQMAGDLSPLLSLVELPLPTYTEAHTAISSLDIPHPPTWTDDKRAGLFRRLLNDYDFQKILLLLGAALDANRCLMIRGFAGDYRRRTQLVQGLMVALPSPARTALTFSTHATHSESDHARIIFSNNLKTTQRWVVDHDAGTFPGEEVLESPYIQHLSALWKGDAGAFIAMLKPTELTAPYLMTGKNLEDGLTRVVERYGLDMQMLAGEDLPTETLTEILTGEVPLGGDLQTRYAKLLLERALDSRDAQTSKVVAHYMDANPSVDATLNDVLNETLQTQPDAVYVFIRARLSEGVDERWQPRLQAAAVTSLNVALHDSASSTLFDWLKLIAREPANYGLGEILHEGILAAQQRAHHDGVLGCQLIALVVKRDIKAIDTLLNDEKLIAELPDEPIGLALRDYNAEAIQALPSQGRELFLVALARASRVKAADVFTPDAVQTLWEVYANNYTVNLPEHYQPISIIRDWIENGVDWLPNESLETLLTLVLASGRDDVFYQLVHHLKDYDALFPLIATVIQHSGRAVTDILGLIGQLVTSGDMTQQQAVNVYIALLTAWGWTRDSLPLVEQLARVMQQSNNLTITSEVSWRLLEVAAEHKNELVSRIAGFRLLKHIQTQPEAELVDQFLRLYNLTQWSALVRSKVMTWWREFIRTKPLMTLQQLDKAMEGKRPLEEARSSLHTAIALRKMLGKRSLEDFADDIGTAFTIMQALVDSFDPSSKQTLNFDQDTVRGELDARSEEISPEKRKLLAKNLRELARMVADMAENRSRPPLMRREEDFERQLTTGEQQPQSAIDTMKWLYGYLDGAQAKDDQDEE